MDKHKGTYWQLVWFLSKEGPEQGSLIGTTDEHWFIEESPNNVGANYLKGICLALCEGWLPDHQIASELRTAVLEISEHLHPSYWSFDALSATPEWNKARFFARQLLDAEKPMVRPREKPFKIEDLIHVDHYRHASEIRGRVRWK